MKFVLLGRARDYQRARITRGSSEKQFEGFFTCHVLWTEVGLVLILFFSFWFVVFELILVDEIRSRV